MYFLFDAPIKSRKVRSGVIAYQYLNGNIEIVGEKYIGYSITEAIKRFRAKRPAKRRKN